MNKLRVELNKILKLIHPRVYFMKTLDEVVFPHVVYDLPQSYFQDDQEMFNLDIDIWDDKEDTTEIEALSNKIWKELNKYYYLDDNIQFTVYRQSRFTIDDTDPRIRRRTLMFSVKYYDRSVN